jgi:uncharacterized protein YdhG (YjbR/CyaY superfamily)
MKENRSPHTPSASAKDRPPAPAGKPATVDAYLAACDPARRPFLEAVRQTIRQALPEARETISWGMPTWKQAGSRGKNIIHMAPAKAHLGIYPGPEAIVHFADRLAAYSCSKGAIRIPWPDRPEDLPLDLIRDMAQWNEWQLKQ